MTSKLKIVLVEKMNSFPTSDSDDSAPPAKIYLLGANKDTSGPLIPLNEKVQFMKERAVPRKTFPLTWWKSIVHLLSSTCQGVSP